jgi:dihydroxyacetone kinase
MPNEGKKSIERLFKLVVSRKRCFVPAMKARALEQGRFSAGAGFEGMPSCTLIRHPFFPLMSVDMETNDL